MKTQPLPVAADSLLTPADRHGTERVAALRAQSGTAASPVARFTGSLDDLPVADLIQILQLAGKSATLTLTHADGESRLWCAAGSITDAESGRLRGETAVYRILAVERGGLTAELQSSNRPRSIFAATQRLLLEAARRKDESVALRARLGDFERCFRIADGVEPERLGCSPVELCLLRSFASARSLNEASEASELGDFETLTSLLAWIDAGQLVDTGTRDTAVVAEPARDSRASPPVAAQEAGLSLVPLVASVRPPAEARADPPRRRATTSWLASPLLWSAAAALMLLPCGYFAGARAARVLEPTATVSALRADPPAAPSVPLSYALEVRVEPPEAEIWLDGTRVASGRWQSNLARNGAKHELRVTAPGFVPATILFVDVAPPVDLRLEPVSSAALSTTAISQDAVEAGVVQPADEAPKPRKRPASARAAVRRDPARTSLRPRPRVVGSAISVSNAPQVQATERMDPIIRRLE